MDAPCLLLAQSCPAITEVQLILIVAAPSGYPAKASLSRRGWSRNLSDAKWELIILESVHGFFLKLLRRTLEDEVPIPRGLESIPLSRPDELQDTLQNMGRWLRLLDLAITPVMLREGLTEHGDHDVAEALLRHYARKKSHDDYDRDKADFVATYLYRNPPVAGQWQTKGLSMDGVAPVPAFEIAVMEILGEEEIPELAPDDARLVEALGSLSVDVEQFEQFDQLVDSGIIQKARRIKHGMGPAFYHPHTLAVIAPYNELVGRKFAGLFEAAASEIKRYAEQVREQGGSLAAPVDGDITVQHLAELEEARILNTEYGRAQDELRYVSRLKKAVDARAQAATAPAAPPAAGKRASAGAAGSTRPARDEAITHSAAAVTEPSEAQRLQEEARLSSVEDSIRSWVKNADARFRLVVPMKFGKMTLTQAEADAFSADYFQEKSFRGDLARVLVRMAAIVARIAAESEELRQKQNSTHLWRPHADLLNLLTRAAAKSAEDAEQVRAVAQERGLEEKVNALDAALEKLKGKSEQVKEILAAMGAKATAAHE